MGLDGYLGLLVAGNREVSGPSYRRAVFSSASATCGPINGATEPFGEPIVAAGLYDAIEGGSLLATFEQRHVGLTLPCDWITQVLIVTFPTALTHAVNTSMITDQTSPSIRIRPGEVIGSVNGSTLFAASALTVHSGLVVTLES